jgi:hypothetical protein
MTAKYDLSIGKGSNFDFWLQYLTEGNTGVNLSPFRAEMQIKRYRGEEYPVLFLSSNGGLTYGYTAGFTTGITGIGSIGLNKKYDNSGLTGGIRIAIDSNATNSISVGKYFYDLKLIIGTGVTYSQKLVEGRISIEGEVV